MVFWLWASRGHGSISYIIVSTRISGSILPIRIIVHRDDTWTRNRWNCPAGLNCTRRRPRRWSASLMDLSWTLWRIWQISYLVTEMWDCVEGCPKWWDWSWRITARGSYLDFEIQSGIYCRWNCDRGFSRWNCSEATADLASLIILSGTVHTRVEVCRMDLEMSRLVERPWLQLMCCAVCLPRGRNFRWRRGSPSGSECWMVCRRWTLEIKFNKRLSLLIIRLVDYSVTTSLIYKQKV